MMLTTMRTTCVLLLVGGLLGATVQGADDSPLTDARQKFSYGLGMSLGNNLKRSGVDPAQVDMELIVKGMKDASAGKTLLTDTEARDAIMAFQTEARTQLAGKNKKAAEEFLAANATKAGIVSTPSGLQYKVLAEGSGESPKSLDNVTVHYKGTLLDGTEFDSSYKRNQPATFGVGSVIKGWTEALQLMRPGAKYELFIKPELAYGEAGRPGIPPNSLLTFEVELLSFQSQPVPPTPPQPVTSDIIKVPSKEELEKGAKIEVIKASELEKYKQQEAEKAKQEKKE